MKSPASYLRRLAVEPPLRIIAKHTLALLPCSVETRARWDISDRPQYLLGLLCAARQALAQKVTAISAIEFGVARGSGLLRLQSEAEAVERASGVSIRVFGFDAGPGGLPEFCGDYRDHPDTWMPGDYAMDVPALEAQLAARTTLILGNIKDTIKVFREEHDPSPIGFVAIDVDLYSSTKAALSVLDLCPILDRLPMYFDDIDLIACHQWAGELLAISEFNEEHANLKIDRWRGVALVDHSLTYPG